MGEVATVVSGAGTNRDEVPIQIGTQEVTVTSEGALDETEVVPMQAEAEMEMNVVGDLVEDLMDKVTASKGSETVPLKKIKENEDATMEVAEELLGEDNKENIRQVLKAMSRKELEDTTLVQIVEALTKHSEAGKFRSKVIELQLHKDKLQQRITLLQKQVVEMNRAMTVVMNNQNRDPNNLIANKKRPPPIKFYRSVGLQVSIEPATRSSIAKVIHMSNTNGYAFNGLKQANGSNTPAKRPGPKSMTDPSVVRSGNGLNKTVATGLTHMNGHLSTSPTKPLSIPSINKQVATPTVVDLTDDSPSENQGGAGPYRVVTTIPGQYQIVNAANGGARGVVMSQAVTSVVNSSGQPIRTVMLRNLAPKSPAVPPRPPAGANMNNIRRPTNVVTATIPARPVAVVRNSSPSNANASSRKLQLPPLPPSAVVALPQGRTLKDLPPRPMLTLTEQSDGIVLSWTLKLSLEHAEIASYEIFACQESLGLTPGKTSSWKRVGDVRALPLPMACTLSQFTAGNRYFFIVRGVDTNGRSGPFCEPIPIVLRKK